MNTLAAPATRTAPKLVWKRVGPCRYEATFNGRRYRIEKTGGLYYMHVFLPENAEHNVRARKDVSMRLRLEWDLVKPHAYLYDFGSSLAKAKANARLLLIEGRDANDDAWED
jgi:hypothetical protein